jgi:preprotein translocase subunit SecF
MALIALPHSFSIPFLRFKWMPIGLLCAMLAAVIIGWKNIGLNLGVDFRGGTMMELRMNKPRELNILRSQLRQETGHEVSVQSLGNTPGEILLRTDVQSPEMLQKIRSVVGKDAVYHKVESIGPKVGKELIKSGCYAIFWALLGMMAYVWMRFEWQFSVCALVALIHDCLGLLAFFMWTRFEFNESAVVAILITAAYSINDTVVIFDRLRENRSQKRDGTFPDLVNASLNETLSRTLLTSSTALMALTMLYFFGGEVIAALSLPILVGIMIGTYSSVVIAVPLLVWLPISPLPSEHEVIHVDTGH